MRRKGDPRAQPDSVTKNCDLLSAFLENPVFQTKENRIIDNDLIVDELIDFFMAATVTSSNLTRGVIHRLTVDEHWRFKVTEELRSKIMDKTLYESGKKEPLHKILTMENV